MPHPDRPFSPQGLIARLAAFLSLLAVVSALFAPVAILAEEVRTGKLGGLCSLDAGSSTASGFGFDSGSSDAPQHKSHCGLCTSPGLALPAKAMPSFAAGPAPQGVSAATPPRIAAAVSGLPFSRGPPAAA